MKQTTTKKEEERFWRKKRDAPLEKKAKPIFAHPPTHSFSSSTTFFFFFVDFHNNCATLCHFKGKAYTRSVRQIRATRSREKRLLVDSSIHGGRKYNYTFLCILPSFPLLSSNKCSHALKHERAHLDSWVWENRRGWWGEKHGEMHLIYFHSRGSYSVFLVILHSERICIEHPNRINLNSLFAQISSRPSYFRLMYQLSEWRCKCDFSSATNSILRLKKVWFDFVEGGKSN